MNEREHRGWHHRGYLPHYDGAELVQTVSFRLADAVPLHLVETWKDELARTEELGDKSRREELYRRVERYEDAGHGDSLLRDHRAASIVEDAMLFFHEKRYRLIAWAIMPNHVHAMLEIFDGYRLDEVMHSWKSYTSSKINRTLGREGKLWFREYYDRYIRNAQHYEAEIFYIENNPVAAGLCARPEQWPLSSARHRNVAARGE